MLQYNDSAICHGILRLVVWSQHAASFFFLSHDMHAAGCVKMTQPTAVVTAFLAWSLLAFPTGYSNGDNTEQGQAAVRWGADYLMRVWSPGTGTDVNIIYQVFAAAIHFTPDLTCTVGYTGVFAFICADLSRHAAVP